MSDETLERFIQQYIAGVTGPEVVFSWQGGEPTLMGLPFFRRVVTLQKKYAKPFQKIENDLQTNATLLDEAWCEFLKEHRFLVGLSIDGPHQGRPDLPTSSWQPWPGRGQAGRPASSHAGWSAPAGPRAAPQSGQPGRIPARGRAAPADAGSRSAHRKPPGRFRRDRCQASIRCRSRSRPATGTRRCAESRSEPSAGNCRQAGPVGVR